MASTTLMGTCLGVLFVVFTLITELEAKYCRRGTLFNFSYTYTNCPYGCCGSFDQQVCCRFPLAMVIGSVAGGIALLVILITICCCCCCCQKGQRTTGQVIQTTPNPVVIQTGMSSNYMAPMYPPGQEMMPPQAYAQPPPAYNDVIGVKASAPAYENHGYT
ncbi:uncharacterized protein LOC121366432 [Gigantopelta aegis]|uniref:uncharacterized protein LOC121366432 n=1 Tax=Gigantopelta aegis TaxID=1735272 RepID=UPI001B888BF5|nr:uncharacterized protein LOC121366432 [Gigantopelta aegis]